MNKTLIKLSNVIDEISMGPFGSDIKVDNFVDNGIPVLNGSNLTSFKLIEDEFRYVTPEKAKTFKKAVAKRGDVVVTHRGTLGQISFIPESSKFEEYVISQSQFRVALNKKLVDPIFFVYYFHTTEGQKRLLANKCHVGVPALAQATTNFKLIEIPLPPLSTQKRISSFLSALDAKIELNNSINAELEAMAKLIYDYWFVQFDFPDEQGKPYKTSGGKMVWNEELKREIPEGWEVDRLGNYAKIKKGVLITEKTADNFGDIKVVSAGIDFSYFHSKPNYPENTITISASGANAGFVNFWREPIFACDCTTVRGKSNSDTMHILGFLKMRQKFICSLARGSAQPHVYPKDIEGLQISIPPKNLIEKHGDIVVPGNEQIANNLKQNQHLTSLRDWLLPMLMNGQVRVGEVEQAAEAIAAEDGGAYGKQ